MDNRVKYNHDSSILVIHLLGKTLFGTKLFTFHPFPHLSHLLDWKTVICKWGELSSSTLFWRACWPVTPRTTALGIKCHHPITELDSPIPVHFSSLIPRMSMFTLAISCLTTCNLPWFTDLTFQVPMQYCSLQHRTLLLSPVTSTAGYCFCFGPSLHSFWSYFSTDLQ